MPRPPKYFHAFFPLLLALILSLPACTGGYHVMLMGVRQDLSSGHTTSVTLVFESAGPVLMEVPVQIP